MVTAEGRGEIGRRYRMTQIIEEGASDEPPLEAPVVDIEVAGHTPGKLDIVIGTVRRSLRYATCVEPRWSDSGQEVLRFVDNSHRAPEASGGAGSGQSVAPLDGAVLAVRATEGQHIR